MKRILVVEDEASIRELVALNLKMTGWEVLEAPSAERALELIQKNPPCDVALLDIMLPGMDGFSLCETIRHGDPYIGIIMASAKGQESDKIRGLSIGADDYITKPFSVSELMARVEALARRVRRSATADDEQAGSEQDQLVSGPFVLDEKSRVLYKSGKPIDLTQVEFQIMELFFRNPGTALVREKILEGVWGKGYFGDVKIVDVNTSASIRNALELSITWWISIIIFPSNRGILWGRMTLRKQRATFSGCVRPKARHTAASARMC